MTNNTIQNMVADINGQMAQATDRIPWADKLSGLVPEEEQGIKDEVTVKLDNKSLYLPVPEEEAAVSSDAETETARKVRELGIFSPVRGLASIKSASGKILHARIYENEEGMRSIECCQQYSDGSYSPKMKIPQAEMRMAARYRFVSKGIEESKIRNKIADFLYKMYKDYSDKFRGTQDDDMGIIDVLNLLYESMSRLPVYSEVAAEMDAETFYWMTVEQIKSVPSFKWYDFKSYYPLDDVELGRVAKAMGMNKLQMLKQLKQHGLLYLTPSSKGYQTNVRFKNTDGTTYTERMYCVYKLEYFAGVESTTESNGYNF